MKLKYKKAYMDMAQRFAQTSEAERLKVGCIFVKNDSIISLGVNGTYPGFETNTCETSDGQTAWYTRHAEQAALDKLTISTETACDASVFITHSPCAVCSLRLIAAKVKNVFYRDLYRDTQGLDLLQKAGIVTANFKGA